MCVLVVGRQGQRQSTTEGCYRSGTFAPNETRTGGVCVQSLERSVGEAVKRPFGQAVEGLCRHGRFYAAPVQQGVPSETAGWLTLRLVGSVGGDSLPECDASSPAGTGEIFLFRVVFRVFMRLLPYLGATGLKMAVLHVSPSLRRPKKDSGHHARNACNMTRDGLFAVLLNL